VRPAVADAVVRALAEPSAPARRAARPPVRVGLDRVAAGETEALAGKRLGLLAHAASVTLDGRHAIDVLRDQGLDLVRLFAPEHGLQSRAAAGEPVASGTDGASGLPVVSLYGADPRPRPEDLAGLDALVVDLQDAGVRFYTYASTMLLALEAAAAAGLELVVLDRPNPLGGLRVAGPERKSPERFPESLVSRAPGPLLHGLTLGEMARYANARRERPARLTVVPMLGWRRGMTWQDTGRPWVPPSPNLRSADAALAYPGVALLEATNVSEGRGTEAPFLRLGAPWLEPTKVRVEVPGFRLVPIRFTPRGSPAAPEPKHRDVECAGFAVEVVDPATADPFALALALLGELAKQPGFAWIRDGAALAWLLGGSGPAELLDGAAELGERGAAARRWLVERAPALLYSDD